MYALMIYSLKVGACLAVFYLFFKLLLSRETFHRLNRIVILAAMSLSFLLPLCVVTVYRDLPELPALPLAAELPQSVAEQTPPAAPFPWREAAGILFILGGAASLCWTLGSLWGVMRIIRGARRERTEEGAVIVRTAQIPAPFSWGRYIVLPKPDTTGSEEAVLLHERAHIRLGHSWDLIATDLAGCLQWFNPAMWLLRRELRAIHEYEADEAVLDSGVDARQYQLLLIRKAAGGRWCSVANSFNHSKLKNRITMMLRKRSSRWAATKTLFVLPLASLAVGAFAQTVYRLPDDKVKKESDSAVLSDDKISIRGIEGKPLYLVDGAETESLDAIDPATIASIDIRKDPETTGRYGDRARDGVVVVTTRASGDSMKTTGRISTIKIAKNPSSDDAEPEIYLDGERIDTERMNALSPSQIGSITVDKRGDEGVQVIRIATKEAQTNAALAGINAAEAGMQMARAVVESVREQLSDSDWEETAQALNEAQEQIDAARKEAEESDERQNKTIVLSGKRTNLATTTGKQPLVVIDGKIVDSEAMNSLDADRIASMEVLKDDSATELYGEKGADGVIRIKTRDEGSTDRSISTSVSVSTSSKGKSEMKKGSTDQSISTSVSTSTNDKGESETEKSRTVTITGNIDANMAALADKYTIFVNGKRATKAQVERISPKKIKLMTIYEGKNATEKFGAEGANGVIEINTRK